MNHAPLASILPIARVRSFSLAALVCALTACGGDPHSVDAAGREVTGSEGEAMALANVVGSGGQTTVTPAGVTTNVIQTVGPACILPVGGDCAQLEANTFRTRFIVPNIGGCPPFSNARGAWYSDTSSGNGPATATAWVPATWTPAQSATICRYEFSPKFAVYPVPVATNEIAPLCAMAPQNTVGLLCAPPPPSFDAGVEARTHGCDTCSKGSKLIP